MKRRKGFTMIETLSTVVLIAFIVLVNVSVVMSISALRVKTRDTVYLSTHNLNCMERIRQQVLVDPDSLLLFYDDSYFGSDYIETTVTIERSGWDTYNVYSVEVASRMRDTLQRLTNKYVITDIGRVIFDPEINSE